MIRMKIGFVVQKSQGRRFSIIFPDIQAFTMYLRSGIHKHISLMWTLIHIYRSHIRTHPYRYLQCKTARTVKWTLLIQCLSSLRKSSTLLKDT